MGIPSATSDEQKIKRAKECSEEGIRAGVKAAVVTCVVTSVPTFYACQTIPWAKANINHTGKALIISAASIAAYFITADKTMLALARKNTDYKRSA